MTPSMVITFTCAALAALGSASSSPSTASLPRSSGLTSAPPEDRKQTFPVIP